ncbi:MAG: cupin domain-containing protein [Planctomycetes bacterium]|nr:cupin domain-containing protein [Planctomycetota bacterium]
MGEAEEIVRRLGLAPLPREGGFFRETWRSAATVATPRGPRPLGTAILYLLAPGTVSALHRLPGEEAWFFQGGDPVEMLLLHPGGRIEEPVLGPDGAAGERWQQVVPGGCWQGARLRAGGRWALLGTAMAPGFDVADWEGGEAETLAAGWPAAADRIRALAADGRPG